MKKNTITEIKIYWPGLMMDEWISELVYGAKEITPNIVQRGKKAMECMKKKLRHRE